MKDSIRISCKRTLTRFCVFLITILMASTLVCTVCADNIPVLKNVDIRLGDTIGLLFHTSIPFDSNVGTVKASINDRDIDTKHVTKYNNDNCCTFLVTGIYPHEISQKITLSLSGLNLQFQTSVKEELKKMLNNSASEDEKRFASDLLQYGDATWQYREHVNGTNRPCDITTNVDGYAPSDDDITTNLINIGNSTSVVHISSIGIAYSDTNHYVIEVEVPQAMQAGAKIDIVFTRHGQVIAEESKTHEGGTQKYSFTSPALEAHKIATESLGVKLQVNDTPVQTIENYGLNNFIAQLSEIGSTSDQGTALQYAKALYYYGESAAKVYNDKRVFAQYIDTSAMQNPRFINDEGKIVFKCDNAKMHVYHYDGTESDIIDIAWAVQNTPTDYHNFYDIAVTGTAKIPSTDQTVVATIQKIRVENTVTFKPSSTIFVETHNNGTLTLPAGKGEVIPAIGLPFQVEWAENALSTTLEAADAKTATGMKALTLSHTFIDNNDEAVVVDVPFVYCNTIKSITVLSTHKIKDEYKYSSPNVTVNANWYQADDGKFISVQPAGITVLFDNDASQSYDITDECGWEVYATIKEKVEYASSISAESPYYEFSVGTKLPSEVFAMVYGDPATYGIPDGFANKDYSVSGKTQIMNRVVSITIHDASMTYKSTSSCDVKIQFALTLESGENVNYEVDETNQEIQKTISGEVYVLRAKYSDRLRWRINTQERQLTIDGYTGVSSYIKASEPISPVDPIVAVQPEPLKQTINVFAENKDTTKISVTLRVKITRASGAQELTDWTTQVDNIRDEADKKIENVKFQNGTCSVTAPVVIWNPIISFNGSFNVDAIDSAETHILMSNKEINVTRQNGYTSTIKLNDIKVPNIQDETLSAERFISYDEYQGECHLTAYKVPRITVIVSNSVVKITPVKNPTAITLNKNQSAYEIPVYLVCKNGQQSGSATATVTHNDVISKLANATWKNNTAQCTVTCLYNGLSADVKLSVTRTGGTINVEDAPGLIQLPSGNDSKVVTVKFKVYYDDNSSVDCENTFRIYSSGTTTQGTPTTSTGGSARVELSYGGVTENYDIFWENLVKNIEITTNPTVKFTGGNSTTKPTGGNIKVTYENGATQTKSSNEFNWSQVTYTGTETQTTVKVTATYKGKSASKSGVTAANPIESFATPEQPTQFNGATTLSLQSTVQATLGNGKTCSVTATLSLINATDAQGKNLEHGLKIADNKSITYGGTRSEIKITIQYTCADITETAVHAIDNGQQIPNSETGINRITFTAKHYTVPNIQDQGSEMKFNSLGIKLKNGQELTLTNVFAVRPKQAGGKPTTTSYYIGLSQDIKNITDETTQAKGTDTSIWLMGTSGSEQVIVHVGTIVSNRKIEKQYYYEPHYFELAENITDDDEFCPAFNKMKVYSKLYQAYANGYDRDFLSKPLEMGHDTIYQLCGAAELDWQTKFLGIDEATSTVEEKLGYNPNTKFIYPYELEVLKDRISVSGVSDTSTFRSFLARPDAYARILFGFYIPAKSHTINFDKTDINITDATATISPKFRYEDKEGYARYYTCFARPGMIKTP